MSFVFKRLCARQMQKLKNQYQGSCFLLLLLLINFLLFGNDNSYDRRWREVKTTRRKKNKAVTACVSVCLTWVSVSLLLSHTHWHNDALSTSREQSGWQATEDSGRAAGDCDSNQNTQSQLPPPLHPLRALPPQLTPTTTAPSKGAERETRRSEAGLSLSAHSPAGASITKQRAQKKKKRAPTRTYAGKRDAEQLPHEREKSERNARH